MSFTRREWSLALAEHLGLLPSLTDVTRYNDTIRFIIGWTVIETRPPGAHYNLLNTTQKASGSTNFNSAGVQNFPTFLEGVETNAALIQRKYSSLYAAIHNQDTAALGFPNGTPSSGVRGDLAEWVHGNRNADVSSYIRGIFGGLNRGADVFNYGSGGGGGGGGGGNGGSGGGGPLDVSKAEEEAAGILVLIDQAMAVTDPFDVGDINVTNVASKYAQILSNVFHNFSGFALRVVVLGLAVFVLYKIAMSFVDTEKLKGDAAQIAQLAAMA